MDSPSSNLYPANNDSPARKKLLSLRLALLRLHKTLLNMERREYEREHGHVNTGELFRAVKVFHEPAVLEDNLARLGWDIRIRTAGWRFYYGYGGRGRG